MMFVTVINKQNKLKWLPIKGMSVVQEMIASGAERSVAQRNDCPRNSIHEGKNVNNAMRIGICNNIGRQPENGLAPALL